MAGGAGGGTFAAGKRLRRARTPAARRHSRCADRRLPGPLVEFLSRQLSGDLPWRRRGARRTARAVDESVRAPRHPGSSRAGDAHRPDGARAGLRAVALVSHEARPRRLHSAVAHGTRAAAENRAAARQQHRAADAVAHALLRVGRPAPPRDRELSRAAASRGHRHRRSVAFDRRADHGRDLRGIRPRDDPSLRQREGRSHRLPAEGAALTGQRLRGSAQLAGRARRSGRARVRAGRLPAGAHRDRRLRIRRLAVAGLQPPLSRRYSTAAIMAALAGLAWLMLSESILRPRHEVLYHLSPIVSQASANAVSPFTAYWWRTAGARRRS